VNWLVHLAVAPADAEHRVGQVLADVLHPRDRAGLGAGVQRGVASHIAIDRFTDRHAAVARSRARVRAPWRRYAGILVDVLYGHLLVRRWDTHLAEPFERFGDAIYAEFLSVSPALPADAAAFTRRFAEERWLEAYRDEACCAGSRAGSSVASAARCRWPRRCRCCSPTPMHSSRSSTSSSRRCSARPPRTDAQPVRHAGRATS